MPHPNYVDGKVLSMLWFKSSFCDCTVDVVAPPLSTCSVNPDGCFDFRAACCGETTPCSAENAIAIVGPIPSCISE